jgi:hypothetical protein
VVVLAIVIVVAEKLGKEVVGPALWSFMEDLSPADASASCSPLKCEW